jgi:hypothetical protein
MLDFEVQRCTRRCAKTERELKPGEVFYSVLVGEGSQVVRHDYAEDAWEGAPETALGWWKSRMPGSDPHKMSWAPNDVILHYFEELGNDERSADERYILTLLMLRRRILRLEEAVRDDEGREVMTVHCAKTDNDYRVPIACPTEERAREIQEKLGSLLFANGT